MSASERLGALNKRLLKGPWKLGFDDGSGRTWPDAFGNRNRESGYIVQDGTPERIVHRGGQDSWGSLVGLERKVDATSLIALRNALPQIVAVVEEAEHEHPEPHNYWAIPEEQANADINEIQVCPMCAALRALEEALS